MWLSEPAVVEHDCLKTLKEQQQMQPLRERLKN